MTGARMHCWRKGIPLLENLKCEWERRVWRLAGFRRYVCGWRLGIVDPDGVLTRRGQADPHRGMVEEKKTR